MAMQAVGMTLMGWLTPETALVCAFIQGCSGGIMQNVTAVAYANFFGRKHLGAIQGFAQSAGVLGASASATALSAFRAPARARARATTPAPAPAPAAAAAAELMRRARCVRRERARPAAVRFRPRPLRLVLRGLGCERRRHGRQRRLLLALHGASREEAGGELDAPPYPGLCFARQPNPSLMLRSLLTRCGGCAQGIYSPDREKRTASEQKGLLSGDDDDES